MSVCTVRCCACGAGPVPGGCWDSGSGWPHAACTSLTLWSSAVRAAVVLHLACGVGGEGVDSVVREGRGLCAVLCVRLKAAHLLNGYPYVLVQHIALSEYSFPFAD